tara:strand:- start:12 stop:203 length:192 start_codon:yes stop_codon:yes gene_type:complete
MKDNCVTCNVETLYDRDDHIDTRIGYVEGSGQLCLDCYDEIYIKKAKPKVSFVKIGRRGKRNN